MQRIRYAVDRDLENLIDLWAEEWNGIFSSPSTPIIYGGSEAPRVSSVLKLAEEFHAQIVCRNILVAEDDERMVGFILFDQNYDSVKSELNMDLLGVWVSRECWLQTGEIASDLIKGVGQIAAKLGYHGMNIALNYWRGEALKEVCTSLGAEHTQSEGEKNMRIQHFQWVELKEFLKKGKFYVPIEKS